MGLTVPLHIIRFKRYKRCQIVICRLSALNSYSRVAQADLDKANAYLKILSRATAKYPCKESYMATLGDTYNKRHSEQIKLWKLVIIIMMVQKCHSVLSHTFWLHHSLNSGKQLTLTSHDDNGQLGLMARLISGEPQARVGLGQR